MRMLREVVATSAMWLVFLIGGVAWSGNFTPSLADEWPIKPLRLIHGQPAGATADIVTRQFAEALATELGQPVLVEARPGGGAGGTIAMNAVFTAEPDGYTLGLGTSGPLGTGPALVKLPWDPPKDFTPISQMSEGTFLLCVNSSLGVSTVGELIAKLKANPGKYNYGSQGVGSSPHLGFELLKLKAGNLDIVHIPYKGSNEVFAAMLAGEIQLMLNSYNKTVEEMVRGGKVRVVGVAGPSRIPELPDLPTLAEAGLPGIDVRSWYGIVAPKNLPVEIQTKLNRASVAALARPDVVQALKSSGQIARSSSPEAFRQLMADAIEQWREVISKAGIKVENQ